MFTDDGSLFLSNFHCQLNIASGSEVETSETNTLSQLTFSEVSADVLIGVLGVVLTDPVIILEDLL